LIATYPALIFLGQVELAPRFLGIAVLLAVVWGGIFHQAWSRALQRYESFGG
jgi:ABC-type uncharacterized transport system permease subunit